MTAKQLIVLMNGRRCGVVEQAGNKLSFTYEPSWPKDPAAVPLSLSMPLTKERHEHEIIDAFMWGLLPDNEITLDAWGKLHHVSARNCFALLGAVGGDCPGAIQFIPAERIEEAKRENSIDWLDGERFAKLMQDLSVNPGRGRSEVSGGQFSLAGAQAKTALCRDGSRWGIPKGRSPTTHILKPLAGQRDGQIENEHFCLRLADRLGFPVAESEVLDVAGIPVICSKRYDRPVNATGQVVRLHQEDMCQALGVHPRHKYENEGGPAAVRIMQLLAEKSSDAAADRNRFVRALAYNFVIAGTDAHAKNYALLLKARQVRLAPLYDIASYLPYMGKERGIKFAMKIGGKYEIDRILPSHWQAFAEEADIDAARTLAYVRDALMRIPGEALSLLHAAHAEGLTSPHLDTLVDSLWQRCRTLAAVYGAEQLPSGEA
jgi:serine/threonine-protein kinase HipA